MLATKPDPTLTELSLSVQGGSCGGDSAVTRIDHAEVQESNQAVTVTVFTFIDNPLPPGAGCGGVGLTLAVPVVLKRTLGDRTLLDGACAPPVPVRVLGDARAECQAPSTPPPGPTTIGRWASEDAGPLATRAEPKMVWTGHEVIVVGGLISDQYQSLSDGAAFDPTAVEWRPIANRPTAGRVLDIAWTGTEVITLGSDGLGLDRLTTASAYNPTSNRWRSLPLPPSSKAPHAVVWTGSRLLVWQPGSSPSGALYDPATDRWTAIPDDTVRGAAPAGAAAWTGHELAVEGAVAATRGGPVEQRLLLFDPARQSWRVSSKPPAELAMWPFLDAGSSAGQVVIVGGPNGGVGPSPTANGQSTGTTLIYDPGSDQWRTVPAPVQNAHPLTELSGGRLAAGTGPLFILDVRQARWATTGPPPGRAVADGLVRTADGAFAFGITTDGTFVHAREPNGAYLWTP